MFRVCAEHGCQEISSSEESRWCEAHTRAEKTSRRRPRTFRESGYDAAWDRLSKRARALQPWCSDCGTKERLTADHLPSAWERKEKGLPLRLVDVDVVCGPCNTRRGSSRPGAARAESQAERAAREMRAQRRDPRKR